MLFELGRSREEVEAENAEAAMQERVRAAADIPAMHPDRSAAWQAEQMMKILKGEIHAAAQAEYKMDTRLGGKWDTG